MAVEFERVSHLEGMCTAHTLAPLLKRLFAITEESSSKKLKEFRAEVNRAASVRVRSSGSITHTSPSAAHRSSNKQHQKKEKD